MIRKIVAAVNVAEPGSYAEIEIPTKSLDCPIHALYFVGAPPEGC